MQRFQKNKHLLLSVAKCKKKLRNAIFKNCDKEFIYAICECILNIVNGNITINKENYNKLKPFKNIFKKLLNKSSLKSKKKILIQKGGFLQFLIPALIEGIAIIASKFFSQK